MATKEACDDKRACIEIYVGVGSSAKVSNNERAWGVGDCDWVKEKWMGEMKEKRVKGGW